MVRELLKLGGRFLGRAALPIAATVESISFLKNLHKYTADEQEFKEIERLNKENQKWIEAMFCIGYKPYKSGSIGSVSDSGAINALYLQRTALLSKYESPDPKKAINLLERSVNTIVGIEDPMGIELYDTQKPLLIDRIQSAKDQIKIPYHPGIDYSGVQEELTDIVGGMMEIQSIYTKKIYNYEKKLQKKLPSNIWWAIKSSATFGLVKKK